MPLRHKGGGRRNWGGDSCCFFLLLDKYSKGYQGGVEGNLPSLVASVNNIRMSLSG